MSAHKDMHNHNAHCNPSTLMKNENEVITFLMKPLFMNVCAKNEGEVEKVLKKQIISGDPLS
jgi:hypothetical protein